MNEIQHKHTETKNHGVHSLWSSVNLELIINAMKQTKHGTRGHQSDKNRLKRLYFH